jgi:hypothetical protein
MTLPQSGLFSNHCKSFICLTYVICAFTYRIVELVFAFSYLYGPLFEDQSSIVGLGVATIT